MSIAEMISLFSLDRIGQANAKFNREKLLAFNTEACAESPKALIPEVRDFLQVIPDSPLNQATTQQLESVLEMNAGMHTLQEAEDKSRFLFADDEAIKYNPDAVEKVLLENDRQGLTALHQVRDVLAATIDWTATALEAAVKAHCQANNLALGSLAQPIRVAISGAGVSPPIFQSMVFLGKDRTLQRIDRCSALIKK